MYRKMIKSIWTLLPLFCLISCEEDNVTPAESSEADFRFVGRVVNEQTGKPVPDVEVFGTIEFGLINLRDTTSDDGRFVLEVVNYQDSLTKRSLNEDLIDLKIASNDLNFHFGLRASDSCNWISTSPSTPLSDARVINSIPYRLSVNYVINPGSTLNLRVLDSAETRNAQTNWGMELELRVLGKVDPFHISNYPSLEFRSEISEEICFPFGELLEVTYTIREYSDDTNETLLGSSTVIDTLERSGEEMTQYLIQW